MGSISAFHHLEFVVHSALQSAFWYCSSFGFERFAEKKEESSTSIAIRNGTAILIMTAYHRQNKYNAQLEKHGDFIKNIAFEVDSLSAVVQEIRESSDCVIEQWTVQDKDGDVRIAMLLGNGSDVTHTLYELVGFTGFFLPGYTPSDNFTIFQPLPRIDVVLMDHVVQNYPIGEMEAAADWYHRTMKLKRFWSVDDDVATSEFSAMKAWLLVNEEHSVQMTLAEGVKGRKGKSQIEEFIDFHGGSGVQHFALLVDDIIANVEAMKKRSVEFLHIPDSYYDILEVRLRASKLQVKEDLRTIRKLKILMDFDENGYLLQIFTKPVQDRPTLFVEIIQRANFKYPSHPPEGFNYERLASSLVVRATGRVQGFGAGNFKALFDAVEKEQEKRGTLY